MTRPTNLFFKHCGYDTFLKVRLNWYKFYMIDETFLFFKSSIFKILYL